MTKRFALIDDKDMVGQMLIAESEEIAQDLADNVFYGITEVVEITNQEGADKVAIGCGWDGEAFIPHAETEIGKLAPTVFTAEEARND
jgi:hypothetical protein